MAFERIEKEGRELAQRTIEDNETTHVQRGQRDLTVDLLDRRNSQNAPAGTSVMAMGKGTETKAALQRMEKNPPIAIAGRTGQVHPETLATSSAQKTVVNLVPEYDSDSDAEDAANGVAEVRKPSPSSVELPSEPTGLPGKPASSMGLSSQPVPSRGLSAIPSSSMGLSRKPASSMGPPALPASAARGKRKEVADQRTGTEAPGQGNRSWSVDMLPLERYTPDGRRIR